MGGGLPGDSPSTEPHGAEIGRARPAQKLPAGRKKHASTLFYVTSVHEHASTIRTVRFLSILSCMLKNTANNKKYNEYTRVS